MGDLIQFDSILKGYNDYFHDYIRLNKKFILDVIQSSKSLDEIKDSIYVLAQRAIGNLIVKDFNEIEDHETLLRQIIDEISSGRICVLTLYFRDLVLNTPSIKKVIEQSQLEREKMINE